MITEDGGLILSNRRGGLTYTERRAERFDKICEEMLRQDVQWGASRHLSPEHWLRILVEEIGEVAKALNDHDETALLEDEIVQVAAVCVQWLGDLERTPEDQS